MGWQLTSAGAPVIPIQRNTYIVTDNQADTWTTEGYLDSGNWAVTGYNTGNYDHTVYLTFALDLIGTNESPVAPPSASGVGVIGTGGTVVTPPVTPPPPPAQPPVSDGSVEAVTAAVLAAFVNQLQAAAS